MINAVLMKHWLNDALTFLKPINLSNVIQSDLCFKMLNRGHGDGISSRQLPRISYPYPWACAMWQMAFGWLIFCPLWTELGIELRMLVGPWCVEHGFSQGFYTAQPVHKYSRGRSLTQRSFDKIKILHCLLYETTFFGTAKLLQSKAFLRQSVSNDVLPQLFTSYFVSTQYSFCGAKQLHNRGFHNTTAQESLWTGQSLCKNPNFSISSSSSSSLPRSTMFRVPISTAQSGVASRFPRSRNVQEPSEGFREPRKPCFRVAKLLGIDT